MILHLQGLGKRYSREWVFRDMSLAIGTGVTGILGPNGSGKSTLMKCLWGQTIPSKGEIRYEESGVEISVEDIHRHITIAAPYMDLIEEFTLEEQVRFHFHYKKPLAGMDNASVIQRIELPNSRGKRISDFSSGMKQRLKLGLALLSEASATFLDEPTTNLDHEAARWYQELVTTTSNRTLLVATNDLTDLPTSAKTINLAAFK
jgi:ABC-type multidrug transport system ATPase subunit